MTSKDIRQDEGVRIFNEHPTGGTFVYPFQYGKTYSALKVIQSNSINDNYTVNVVVPYQYLADQWKFIIKEKSKLMGLTPRIFVYVAGTKNIPNDKADLLIIDEIHRFTTPIRKKVILKEYFDYDKILGLTASYPKSNEFISYHAPVIDFISYYKAIDEKWISGVEEYNLKLTLPDDDQYRYTKFTEFISDMLSRFRDIHKELHDEYGNRLFENDYSVIMACYRGASIINNVRKRVYISSDIIRATVSKVRGWRKDLNISDASYRLLDEQWNPVNLREHVYKFNSFINDRNAIISEHTLKKKAVLDIFSRNVVPTICFNGSIDFADAVRDTISKNVHIDGSFEIAEVYHSKIPSRYVIGDNGDYIRYSTGARAGELKKIGSDTLKKQTIERLNDGRVLFVSAVKSLKEGLAIPKLRQIICTSGDTNPELYFQMVGRGMSIDDDDENKKVVIINIYFDDFVFNDRLIKNRDLVKLISRQAYTENTVRWIDDIKELPITNDNE